jgi:hypothetical protein
MTYGENVVFVAFYLLCQYVFTLMSFGSYDVGLVLAESIHVLQRAQVK